MTLYKVIDRDDHVEGKAFHTSQFCYSHWVQIPESNKRFYDQLFSASNLTKVGIDAFVILANAFSLFGYDTSRIFGAARTVLTSAIPGALGHMYEINTVPRVEIDRFAEMCQSYRIEFRQPVDALMLWEHLYECVRLQSFPDAPSRLASYFAFRESSHAREYAGGDHDKLVCEVDESRCARTFEADMMWVDSIANHYSHAQAVAVMERYWSRELSASPRVEVLLNGDLTLGRVIS